MFYHYIDCVYDLKEENKELRKRPSFTAVKYKCHDFIKYGKCIHDNRKEMKCCKKNCPLFKK